MRVFSEEEVKEAFSRLKVKIQKLASDQEDELLRMIVKALEISIYAKQHHYEDTAIHIEQYADGLLDDYVMSL